MTPEEDELLKKAFKYIEKFAKEGCDKSVEWIENYKKLKSYEK
jgi:hypothetical protein